jgi:uncharacterized protein YjgD (DUF1641 family)
MAEPIRNFTPARDARAELRRNVEQAPIEHAEAVLAAYAVLQQAHDDGALDRLQGLLGARPMLLGKLSEFANSPEAICAMRNLLAAARLLGELDPALLDRIGKAMSASRGFEQREPASLWRILRRLTSPGSRRTLAALVGVVEAVGQESSSEIGSSRGESHRIPILLPVIAVSAIAIVISYWVGKSS